MEEPITIGELHDAAKLLAKNKVPGRDGILVEFYLVIWEQIGPILLAVLQKGLEDGSLHPKLTEGVIVLLAKLGD